MPIVQIKTSKGLLPIQMSLNQYGLYGSFYIVIEGFTVYIGNKETITKRYNDITSGKIELPKKFKILAEKKSMLYYRKVLPLLEEYIHDKFKVSYYQAIGYSVEKPFALLNLYQLK